MHNEAFAENPVSFGQRIFPWRLIKNGDLSVHSTFAQSMHNLPQHPPLQKSRVYRVNESSPTKKRAKKQNQYVKILSSRSREVCEVEMSRLLSVYAPSFAHHEVQGEYSAIVMLPTSPVKAGLSTDPTRKQGNDAEIKVRPAHLAMGIICGTRMRCSNKTEGVKGTRWAARSAKGGGISHEILCLSREKRVRFSNDVIVASWNCYSKASVLQMTLRSRQLIPDKRLWDTH